MSKFKYLLLGGVVGLLTISSFSNAGSITFTSNGDSYSPSSVDLPVNISELTVGDYVCNDETECGIQMSFGSTTCLIAEWGDDFFNACSSEDYQGVVSVFNNRGSSLFDSITLNYPGDSGGGDSGDPDSGLIGQLFPVVEGLKNTINEFIPYVVYIGLGLLSAILGFVAIKWLINRVRRQSFSVFSSRKKRK